MIRYPLAPLAEAMKQSETQACRALGVSSSKAKEYRAVGLSEKAADRLATRAGWSPLNIWPDWGQEALEKATKADQAVMVECADDHCTQRFLPTRKGHRFCSRRCSKRHNARTRYQQDPNNRARRLAAARRYAASIDRAAEKRRKYRAQVDDNRAKARAYYQANRDRIRARRRARYHETKGSAA